MIAIICKHCGAPLQINQKYCSRCGAPISPEEKQQNLQDKGKSAGIENRVVNKEIRRKSIMKELLYMVEPQKTQSTSSAATFCKVLGGITFIVGLIISVSTANVTSYYGSSFSFITFISQFIIYGIVGGVLFCLAELFQNIQSIADSLQCLRVVSVDNAFKMAGTVSQNVSSTTSGTDEEIVMDPQMLQEEVERRLSYIIKNPEQYRNTKEIYQYLESCAPGVWEQYPDLKTLLNRYVYFDTVYENTPASIKGKMKVELVDYYESHFRSH